MKLSVMMVTYNHERFIAQALESILAQRVNFDYEIVVGEDCSTDCTRDILMDFCRRFPDRIVPLLRDRNIGAIRNAEATFAACQGQYLALIEGDDYWTCDNKLQKQVDFLDAHPDHAICCHRAQVLDETDKGWNGVQPSKPEGSYTIEDLFDSNWIMSSSVVYRWGLIGAFPSWLDEMKLGDWPRHVLMARFGKINLMDEVMAVYRVHPGGFWSSLPPITQLREIMGMLSVLDKHLSFEYTDKIRQTLARLYLEMALSSRMDGKLKETRRYLFNCFRTGGLHLHGRRRILAALVAYSLRLVE